MTVGAGYAPAVYAGNGSAHTFSFTWPLLAADHLVVELTSGETTTALVRNVDYLLTWVGSGATGSVRLIYMDGGTPVNDPPAVGETVTISRNVPISQETDLRRGPFFPEVVEQALDRLTMVDQQQQSSIDSAQGRIEILESSIPSGAPVSLAMMPVVAAETLASARGALDVPSSDDAKTNAIVMSLIFG